MEVEVIDDADKSVRQQANGCHRNRLLKGGQEKMEAHIVGHRRVCISYIQMMPRIYIGRRGEGGKSEDVKKMEMNLAGMWFRYDTVYIRLLCLRDKSVLSFRISVIQYCIG
jgi:hypothetical protein